MTHSPPTPDAKVLARDLLRHAEARRQAVAELAGQRTESECVARVDLDEWLDRADAACTATEALARANDEQRRRLVARAIAERRQVDQVKIRTFESRFAEASEESEAEVQEALRDSLWEADALFEAGEAEIAHEEDRQLRRLQAARASVASSRSRRARIVAIGKTGRAVAREGSEGGPPPLEEALRVAEARMAELGSGGSGRGAGLVMAVFLLVVGGGVMVVLVDRLGLAPAAAVGTATAFAAGWAARRAIRAAGLRRAAEKAEALDVALDAAEEAIEEAERRLVEDPHGRREALARARDAAYANARAVFARACEATRSRGDLQHGRAHTALVGQVAAIDRAEVALARWFDDRLERRLRHGLARLEKDRGRAMADHQEIVQRTKHLHEKGVARADRAWEEAQAAAFEGLDRLHRACKASLRAWDDPSWSDSPLPELRASVLAFGRLSVTLDLGHDRPGEAVSLPATFALDGRAGLFVEGPGPAGSGEAIRPLIALAIRALTSLPPGSVRFTFIDPVGRGSSFAGLVELGDLDESLVGRRVWTEPAQIAERLEELTAHVEHVHSRDLRGEYRTVYEYHAASGDVSEPIRILVVADFPAGFDEASARRLLKLVESGPACGVVPLIGRQGKADLPSGLLPNDFRAHAEVLRSTGERSHWAEPDLAACPVEIDPPPDAPTASRLLRRVGEASRDFSRNAVPFEFVAPTPESYWEGDAGRELHVAIGKAGVGRRQAFRLGRGTAHHVLVSGKTGSGKSTLMHTLIVNLALTYPPDELELYLIDFKRGVEFKVYDVADLPHARVIAIESDREFGLSVLQRLDGMIRERGEVFRDLGVTNLAGYRATPDRPPMPRALLMVDEFHEFFAEEDRIAREAATLLDRLVRQGRAFGVHALLGSQSLGGGLALPRTTLGQMGVRIALQSGEADSRVILGDENDAAKYLVRPGDAIYNDANGSVEGNQFFRIAWLADSDRTALLDTVRSLSHRAGGPGPAPPRIVFEGGGPADLASNRILERVLRDGPPGSPAPFRAWLGDAVAIKDPTSAEFRPISGDNLLILGSDLEAARGVLSAAVVSLAAAAPTARFYLADSSHPDDVASIRGLAGVIPNPSESDAGVGIEGLLRSVAAEVVRRSDEAAVDDPAVFLVLCGLHGFRTLRRDEDGFDLPIGRDQAPTPVGDLTAILRDGPLVGVHAILWCDGWNNLLRSLGRPSLRHFNWIVLFQMGADDSNNLIDSPAASRLGPNRALLVVDANPTTEKFRPYSPPSPGWLEETRRRLAASTRGSPAGDRPERVGREGVPAMTRLVDLDEATP